MISSLVPSFDEVENMLGVVIEFLASIGASVPAEFEDLSHFVEPI